MFSNLVVIVLLNLAYSTAFKSLPHPIRNKQSIYAVEHSDAFVSLKKSLSTIFIGAGIMFSPSASNYIANAAEAKAPPAATSAAPLKLIEEINYEGALLKRSTGKQRLADLNSEIKASKNKIYSLEKEVSRAETTVNKINTNLKNKNIDKVKMSDLQMEKEAQRTFIAEKKQIITSLERAIERDTTEIKTLERRVKSDEENIKTRAEQLKKRKEELVKEAAEAKRNAIKKDIELANKEKGKIENTVKKNVETSKKIQKTLEKLAKEKSSSTETQKKLTSSIKDLEKKLQGVEKDLLKSNTDLASLQKKLSDIDSRTVETKNELSASEIAVKESYNKLNTASNRKKSLC